MKVIELFNKIANGEEVPNEVKIDGYTFLYDETDGNEFMRYKDMEDDYLIDIANLNDEVEVLEEIKR